ncbi:MAG: DUF427 domain-containing protein [Acidimicrobiales bacterium]
METSGYVDRPDYRVDILRRRNRVTARLGPTVLAQSSACLVVDEQDHGLVVYFPRADVDVELHLSERHTTCPFKGTATYWSVDDPGGAGAGTDVAWSYESPFPQVGELAGYIAFFQDRVQVEIGVAERVVRMPTT